MMKMLASFVADLQRQFYVLFFYFLHMNFLPKDYEPPAANENYMKFEQGKNKFRILADALVGWVWWKEDKDGGRKSYRIPMEEGRPPQKLKAKHFWFFPVWNYKTKGIQLLEITQKGIQEDILEFINSEEWEDPLDYDLTIARKGKNMSDTKYSVMPSPKEDLDVKIAEEFENTFINLDALFEDGDPFADPEDVEDGDEGGEDDDEEEEQPKPRKEIKAKSPLTPSSDRVRKKAWEK